jgi:hypothetical protein
MPAFPKPPAQNAVIGGTYIVLIVAPVQRAERLPCCRVYHQYTEEPKMPAILLWLLGIPIPIIILLVLLWH